MMKSEEAYFEML